MSRCCDTACGVAVRWRCVGLGAAIRSELAASTQCREPGGKYVEMPAPFIIVKGRFVADRFD